MELARPQKWPGQWQTDRDFGAGTYPSDTPRIRPRRAQSPG